MKVYDQRRELHRLSQKRRLVVEVYLLCRKLGRPVSPGDLRDHFRRNPERRPLLTQSLGLQLAKAARFFRPPVRHIHKIGVWGKKTFYAAHRSPFWVERFRTHIARKKATALLRLHPVDMAVYLLETPFAATGHHTLAGFILEADRIGADLREGDPLLARLKEEQREARRLGSAEFVPLPPARLFTKEEAGRFLREEAKRRRETETALSLFRYFAQWRWPQSELYPPIAQSVFVPHQLLHLVQTQWPAPDENPLLARALLVCGRYGYEEETLVKHI